jgi:hypothetical protein
MRSYAIACEFHRVRQRQHSFGEAVRQLSVECSQPSAGLWLVKTALSAAAIRKALLPHLDFNDRLFVCEAGEDRAEFNGPPPNCNGEGKVLCLDHAREPSKLLAAIFSRDGGGSRHLKAATVKSLQSA